MDDWKERRGFVGKMKMNDLIHMKMKTVVEVVVLNVVGATMDDDDYDDDVMLVVVWIEGGLKRDGNLYDYEVMID